MAERQHTHSEELLNAATHALGIIFSLVAIPLLLWRASDYGPVLMRSVAIFGVGMLLVYTSSTLLHALHRKRISHIFEITDHISIFILIAGTYTPLVVIFTDHNTAFIFLSIMWGIAMVGSLMKIFFLGKYKIVSVVAYLAMGWMAIFIFKPLVAHVPLQIFWWILAGGLAYTLGVIFFLWRKLYYHHAVWHLCVLVGTVSHFFAVYYSIPLQMNY